MNNAKLLVRLMAEVKNAAEAEIEMHQIVSLLKVYGSIENVAMAQYWKIAAYWEITIAISPFDEVLTCFNSLLALTEHDWILGGSEDDHWAVWNPVHNSIFITPKIKWTEIQII